MAGLFHKGQGIKGGKYLVTRRDGTIPVWPFLVLGAKDPAAPTALRAYADKCEQLGMDPEYVSNLRDLADEFEKYLKEHGPGDPDGARHRKDDPETVARMEEESAGA
jgi:hypothetical protein